MAAKQKISVKINGVPYSHDVEPRLLLVHYLRDIVGLTGTHIGCETSICGACTVMLDNMAVKSCTVLSVSADGACFFSIERPAHGGELPPSHGIFLGSHGLQFGYCTPGVILSAH